MPTSAGIIEAFVGASTTLGVVLRLLREFRDILNTFLGATTSTETGGALFPLALAPSVGVVGDIVVARGCCGG